MPEYKLTMKRPFWKVLSLGYRASFWGLRFRALSLATDRGVAREGYS
jgi:hypothetical protein